MTRPRTEPRRQMMALTVQRRVQLSAHFVRVTVGGEALASFVYQGADQCFRLFFPKPGQPSLQMPAVNGNGWAEQYFQMPAHVQPFVRNYSVRDFRPTDRELDVDFVIHGDGPAAAWAQTARPGSPAGIFDEGRRYWLRDGAAWQLLVADESALPAALAIAEQTPPTMPTRLIAEVPSADDCLDVRLADHIEVNWLPRTADTTPGRLALGAALAEPPPPGPGSVFAAGENALATGVRRGLIATGVPRSAISFFGYWKHDRATAG